MKMFILYCDSKRRQHLPLKLICLMLSQASFKKECIYNCINLGKYILYNYKRYFNNSVLNYKVWKEMLRWKWCYAPPVISALGRLRQENQYKFKANLLFTLRHRLKSQISKTRVHPVGFKLTWFIPKESIHWASIGSSYASQHSRGWGRGVVSLRPVWAWHLDLVSKLEIKQIK